MNTAATVATASTISLTNELTNDVRKGIAPATIAPLALVPAAADWHYDLNIGWVDGSWYTEEKHQSHNGTTFHVYHGHATEFTLPTNTRADRFASWMAEEVEPLISVVVAGYSSKWNGNNHIAQFTEEAKEAKERIEQLLSPEQNDVPVLGEYEGFWDARDYLSNLSNGELGITAETTDEQIGAIADKHIEEAEATYVVLERRTIVSFLTERRDELVDAE